MGLSNKLEELLSGYLDNQLNADELREVDKALQENPEAREYLEHLTEIRGSLQVVAAQTKAVLPASFSQNVMAQIAAAKVPASPVQVPNPVSPAAPTGVRWDGKLVAALVGLAAMLMLAVYVAKNNVAQNNGTAVDPGAGTVDIAQGKSDDPSPERIVNSGEVDPQEQPTETRLVRRDDLRIHYIMTVDVELSKNTSTKQSVAPLFEKFGVELIKGAKLNRDIEKALNDIRVTAVPEQAPLDSEVYLIRAASSSLDSIFETMREDKKNFPLIRFGISYELPNDPLLDKLSSTDDSEASDLMGQLKQKNGTVALGQAIADAVGTNAQVTTDLNFVTPLVQSAEQEFRASPFEAIPAQGKLVGSSRKGTQLDATLESSAANGEMSFLLLFVRQR